MKKLMIMTAILFGLSVPTMADNAKMASMAKQFDKRITMGYIFNDNTVVLRGHWPKKGPSFQADFVAKSWCQEFDSNIIFIQLRTIDNSRMIGGSMCS